MEPYVRKIHYYETDKMGFTHHSNYIRFMEEARIDFFEKLGKGYREVEEDGVYSPVMSASCEYKKPTDFGDILEITVGVERLKPLRFVLTYTMKRDGAVVAFGKTEHCFLNRDGKFVNLEKKYPDVYEALVAIAEAD